MHRSPPRLDGGCAACYVCVCACMRACACLRACGVRARVCVCVCVCACVWLMHVLHCMLLGGCCTLRSCAAS
jgi:hypothetical protein